jgi:type IV secretion system protein VirB8
MVNFLTKTSASGTGEAEKKKAFALAETKNWYKDAYQAVVVQRNFLAVATFTSLIGVVVLGMSLASLSDSKIFEPFVIEVDSATGVVTRVDSRSVEKLTQNTAVARSFLARYLMAREGYSPYTFDYDFRQFVRLLSTTDIYRDFRFSIGRGNKDSPLNLQRKSRREVLIKSITFLEKGRVQMRFVVNQIDYGSNKLSGVKHYISTIDFVFNENRELKTHERYVNPLGFEVRGYQRNEEFVQ